MTFLMILRASILTLGLFVSPSISVAAMPLDKDLAIVLRDIKINEWPSYYRTQDADGLANFLSRDFVFITDDGSRSNYIQEVDWVRNNPWSGAENDDFVYHIEDIVLQSDQVAIIYGEGVSTRTTEAGEPCRHSYWSSNTLRLEDGRWKPTFSHVSGVACTPLTALDLENPN